MKKIIKLLFLTLLFNVKIFAAGCVPDVGAIAQVSIPYSYSGTTCGFNDNYATSGMCGQTLYGPGDDFLFQLNITTAPVNYKITIGGAGTYKSISVFSGCPAPVNNPSNCVGTMITTGFGTTGAGTFTFPTNGAYYILIDEWPAPQCGAFTLDIAVPPPAPANDNCGTSQLITTNSSCVNTNGDLSAATNSGVALGPCFGTPDDDVWYRFVCTSPTQYFTLTCGFDAYMQLFSGTCASLTSIQCSDPNTFTATGLTIGQTYYLRIFSYASGAPAAGNFQICITDPPTCPAGLGSGVVNVASLPYASGAGTTCGFNDDLTSAIANCGSSLYFTGEDKVFIFTPTTSGNITINLTSAAGSYTGLMLYNGCPFTASCVGSSQSSTGSKSLVACVNAGTTYYLVLDSWTTPVCNAYSNLTISTPGAITGNDFCATPTPIAVSSGNLLGNTTTYTVDSPGNISGVFCGSIENNQWYSFVATSTSQSFTFSVSGCTNGWGIQAQVFSVTTTGSPCVTCNTFTSMGTCYNPGTTTGGTTTATGLTVGQTYYLMIDGNAGDVCNFTLNNWATTILLPINLVSFKCVKINEFNKLEWTTSPNSLGFYIAEKSTDGRNFYEINKIDNNSIDRYSILDKSTNTIEYYRICQVNDNEKYYSNIISVSRDILNNSDILKIVNTLGQEVNIDYEGLKIIIFKDGSVLKKY